MGAHRSDSTAWRAAAATPDHRDRLWLVHLSLHRFQCLGQGRALVDNHEDGDEGGRCWRVRPRRVEERHEAIL